MKTNKNASIVSCPPCGERACPRGLLSGVAVATKRGAYKAFSLMSPSIGPADHFLRKGGRKGFTLIELLVVVLIIGILAAVAVPQYQVAVAKSRLATYMLLVKSLVEAEESYYLANGHYTDDLTALDVEPPNEGCTYKVSEWGNYYRCADFSIGVYNDASNVQVQLRNSKQTYIAYLQYFTDEGNKKKGDIFCFSKGETARNVCRSLGPGEERESDDWEYVYQLSR